MMGVRRVRTPAGERRYHKPITSIITRSAPDFVKRAREMGLPVGEEFTRFVQEHDHGGGCEDIGAAVEDRYGFPQQFGYYRTDGGVNEWHSWNAVDDYAGAMIIDFAQSVFGVDEEAPRVLEPDSELGRRYRDEAGDPVTLSRAVEYLDDAVRRAR